MKKHVFGLVAELFFHDRTPFLSYRSLQIPGTNKSPQASLTFLNSPDSVEGRLLPDKMESSTATLGMAARGGRLHLSWLIQFYKNPSSPSLNLKIAGNAVFTKPIDF